VGVSDLLAEVCAAVAFDEAERRRLMPEIKPPEETS
jgi:hypothetical protein